MNEKTAQTIENPIRGLDASNTHFCRSEGGLLALDVTEPDGTVRHYDRVIVLRPFPLTHPDSFLSVREPKGERKEIGMIRHIHDLDEASEELVTEELRRRYFIPKILKIDRLYRRGAVYISADTDVGHRTILLRDDVSGIRLLDGGRVLLTDMDGNSYEIPDPMALDKVSYRKIEIFL